MNIQATTGCATCRVPVCVFACPSGERVLTLVGDLSLCDCLRCYPASLPVIPTLYLRAATKTCYTIMDQSPTERPRLFGSDGSPSSAGLAAGSEVQSPGGADFPRQGATPPPTPRHITLTPFDYTRQMIHRVAASNFRAELPALRYCT